MSFHIKDDFKAGAPISQVPASWFNAVAKFLNGLVGGFGIDTRKSESGRSTVSMNKQTLQQEIDNITQNMRISKDSGTPADHTDDEADDDADGDEWTWTANGTNGVMFDVYCRTQDEEGWHYLSRARLTYSKDGLLVKAEGMSGRREVKA